MTYLPDFIYEKDRQNHWNGYGAHNCTIEGAELMKKEMIAFISDIIKTRIEMDGKPLKDFSNEEIEKLYDIWSKEGGFR